MTPTMDQVVAFVDGLTDADDFDTVLNALQASHDRMLAERAASVKVGDTVRLLDSTPRYLDGLVGTVVLVEEGYAMVELSVESTGLLRFCPANIDYPVGGVERFVLPSVSLACCFTTKAAQAA